jgi:transposase InsO family protein
MNSPPVSLLGLPQLGLSARQVYTLVQRLRQADGALIALLPRRSDGGRAKPRLAAPRENLLQRLIEEIYLTSQKRSAAELVRAIHRHAEQVGVQPPSESTIRRRLKRLSLSECRRRGDAYPQTQPVDGRTPPAEAPLDWVQIDHTPVDVIVVDPIDRMPIGRPYLTVAIDVFSRCIAGFHLSLEAPSATSVGLCLTLVASARDDNCGEGSQKRTFLGDRFGPENVKKRKTKYARFCYGDRQQTFHSFFRGCAWLIPPSSGSSGVIPPGT